MSTSRDQTKYVDFPRTHSGTRLDKKTVKDLYDASDFVEWSPFVESQRWNPFTAWKLFPHKIWVAEKRGRVQHKFNSELSDFTLTFKNKWLKDIRNTLEQYPKAVDNVMAMAITWISEMRKNNNSASPKQMRELAGTIKMCIEAKKSILMIQGKVAEVNIPEPDDDDDNTTEWRLDIIGGEQMTPKQLTELIVKYEDKPMRLPEELDAET